VIWSGAGENGDAEIRELLSSTAAISNTRRKPAPPELVEGAIPYNENITVDELLGGSHGKEDRKYYSDEEWYKKTDLHV
jgi:hypothetical protein